MTQDTAATQTVIAEDVVVDRATDGHDARSGGTTTSTLALAGAELFGTFLLVFVGLGAALYASQQGLGSWEVALAFGLALMAGIAAVGHVSGGHFNPAVTLGSAVAGRTPWAQVPVYWVSQVVGAVAGAAALFATIPSSFGSSTGGFGSLKAFFSGTANGYGAHSPLFSKSEAAFYGNYLQNGYSRADVDAAIAGGQLQAPTFHEFSLVNVLIIEVVVTALFVGVILAVTDRRVRSRLTPVIVGLTLAVLLLVATPASGGSLNPARSLAAAVFSDGWAFSQVWLFWVAPLLGAAIAALFYRGFAPDLAAAPVALAGAQDEVAVEEDAAEALAAETSFAPTARAAEVTVEETIVAETVDADGVEETVVVDDVTVEETVVTEETVVAEDVDPSTTDETPADEGTDPTASPTTEK